MQHSLTVVAITMACLLMAGNALADCTAATRIILQKPDGRYVDHADGTVTDVLTGLMWKKCSEGQVYSAGACTGTITSNFTWKAALERPGVVNADVNLNAGYNDWRVPNVNELSTLVDRSCTGSWRINTTLFPSVPSTSSIYWTSTPYAQASASNIANAQSAWYIRFDSGVENVTSKDSSTTRYLRLVRDAN